MHKELRGLMALAVIALAGCSATPPADPAKVADAAPARKECVETTGSMMCRKPGSGNVQTMSLEAFKDSGTFRSGSSGPGGVK